VNKRFEGGEDLTGGKDSRDQLLKRAEIDRDFIFKLS